MPGRIARDRAERNDAARTKLLDEHLRALFGDACGFLTGNKFDRNSYRQVGH